MNLDVLDLDELDCDVNAIRDIHATISAANLAAALSAGTMAMDQYDERVADMDEVVIDAASSMMRTKMTRTLPRGLAARGGSVSRRVDIGQRRRAGQRPRTRV